MKEYKLITILKTFSKSEMKDFGLFISSPYHNRKRDFKPLFSILKKYYPAFPQDRISESSLYRKLYPDKKYNKVRSSQAIRVLFSQLTRLAEEFIVYEKYKTDSNKLEFNTSMSVAFADRGLLKHALINAFKNSAALDSVSLKPEFYYDKRIGMNIMLSGLSKELENSAGDLVYQKDNLLNIYAYTFFQLSKYLNNAFAAKYNYNCSVNGIELSRSFVNSFDVELFDRECRDDNHGTKNIVLFNYFIMKSRLNDDDNDSLFKALDIYFKIFNKVSQDTQFQYFTSLFNRLIGKSYLGKSYHRRASELIDFVWGKGVVGTKPNSYLSIYPFNTALQMKAYISSPEDLRIFINRYVEMLPPEFKEGILDYSMALVLFKEKEYGKCLEALSKKDNLPAIFMITKYKLRLCSLYETGLYEEAMYAVVSFEKYVKRSNSLGPSVRHSTFKFIDWYKTLERYRAGDYSSSDNVLSNFNEISMFSVSGEWLCKKYKDIMYRRELLTGT